MLECVFEAQLVSSSEFVQNDQRSARNRMVIARMPEDRSETLTNVQQPFQTFKPYTPACVHL
eukprot:15865277-Heterocapsa_arctica.AAC.1